MNRQDRTSFCSNKTIMGTNTLVYNFNMRIFVAMSHFEITANFTHLDVYKEKLNNNINDNRSK